MGLLDSVVGAMGQQQPEGQPNLMSVVLALLQSSGGLSGLLQKLEANGLGDIAKSWIAQGPNQPLTGDQLHQALDPGTVAHVSQQLGVSPSDAMAQLSRYLPQVVDKLSPNGQMPANGQGGLGNVESMAGMLSGLFK